MERLQTKNDHMLPTAFYQIQKKSINLVDQPSSNPYDDSSQSSIEWMEPDGIFPNSFSLKVLKYRYDTVKEHVH